MTIPPDDYSGLFFIRNVDTKQNYTVIGWYDEADFDGDVLSIRGLYSDEANIEAEEIMQKKISALDISGKNSKTVSKEVLNSLYELTRNDIKGNNLPAETTKMFLGLNPSDISLTMLDRKSVV